MRAVSLSKYTIGIVYVQSDLIIETLVLFDFGNNPPGKKTGFCDKSRRTCSWKLGG